MLAALRVLHVDTSNAPARAPGSSNGHPRLECRHRGHSGCPSTKAAKRWTGPSRRCSNGSEGRASCNDAQLRIDDHGALAEEIRDCAPPEAGLFSGRYTRLVQCCW